MLERLTKPQTGLNMTAMTKKDALKLFRCRSLAAIGRLLGISRQAVCQWPDPLPQRLCDELRGAALRLGYLRD